MAPFDRSHTSSYWRSILTMALSRIVSEIKFQRPHYWVPTPRRSTAKMSGMKTKLQWCGTRGKKFADFAVSPESRRVTDGRTEKLTSE